MMKKKIKRRVTRVNKTTKIKIHLGVKIIAILLFINATFTAVFGLVLIGGEVFGADWTMQDILMKFFSMTKEELQSILKILSSLFIAGVLFLIFGIIDFLIGYGLWKGRQWARIVTIVLMGFLLLSSIISFDALSIILSVVIGGYLLFGPGVGKSFRN